MMTLNEFAEMIKEEMAGQHPELQYEICDITKNNGVCLKSLSFQEKNSTVFPNLYLDYYYHLYQNGESTISDICEKMWEEYKRVKEKTPQFDTEKMLDKVRDKVIYRLVNLERNRNKLQNCPFVPMQDLAIVFYLPVEMTENGMASCMVDNFLMQKAGLSLDELYANAKINTPRLLEPKVETILNVILGHMSEEERVMRKEEIESMHEMEQDMPMYVITNKQGINGAGVLLYDGVLSQLAYELDTDELVIFPSSVHECIVMKRDNGLSLEYMREMVLEANLTCVAELERLSDNIYIYSRKSGTISVSFA